ncbi:Metallo-dependent hydrolase [Hypoxylon sp. NC1633]|nr:Metallo-dependent hydrolase [Hypoxylon sp. NC1633]
MYQRVFRWDIQVRDGKVAQIHPSTHITTEPPKLLLPSLCHPHIHIDKPFILTCNHPPSKTRTYPDYSDLIPETGSFDEALSNTSKAKMRYTQDDLYLRGCQLLAASYRQGVTSLRAFVELDHCTGDLPLTTAIRLKSDFSHLLDMQICAFAQDPLLPPSHGEENRPTMTSLLKDHASSIQVPGTTPYVEETREASLQNIEWAITTAIRLHLHLDFHIDYNLNLPTPSSQPLTFSVIKLLQKHDWLGLADRSKTIVLGHCTQLTVLRDSDFRQLAEVILQTRLPIYFVGLPTSDMFMMGRPSSATNATQSRPRGTLQVPSMIKDLGLSACLGVNNVGNPFTPFGSGDPLQMASWGVAIFNTGTAADAVTLYGCISWLARRAIGLEENARDDIVVEGRSLEGMLLIDNREVIELPGAVDGSKLKILARQRMSLKDVVWDPPETELRSVIR